MLGWLTTPPGIATAALVSVGGGSAAGWLLPAELAVGGAAVLVVGMAGVAATRAAAKAGRSLTSTATIAGLAGVGALIALGGHSTMLERGEAKADRAAVEAQIQTLVRESQSVATGKRELASEREGYEKQVRDAVEKIVAPERAGLQAAQARVEADQRAATDPRLPALAAEARKLSPAQLDDLRKAIEVFNANPSTPGRPPMRIVGEPYDGTGNAKAQQRTIEPSRVVATLVMTGQVYAGPTVQSSDDFSVVPPAAAQRITTVAQLVEYLRLATNLPLQSPS